MKSIGEKGLLLAGFANVAGVLTFSRGFSNTYLNQLFPDLFGNWGLVCIMLWGLAYASVSKGYASVPRLLAVFAVEKLVYVISWFWWLTAHGAELPAIWSKDVLTALFYCLYGVLDMGFGVFFWSLYVSCKSRPA